MRLARNLIILSFVSVVATPARARVFSFQDNWVAAYLRGTAGQSSVGDSATEDTSGNLTNVIENDVDYNFSGEIGFSFLLGDTSALRVGVEGLQTRGVSAIGNSTSVGSPKHMDIESKATVFSPVVALEWSFAGKDNTRYFAFGGAGYSQVKVSNDYTLNALAGADYGTAVTAYKDAWYANVLAYHVGVGMENYLLDNVTLSLEAGYRLLDVSEFSYQDSGSVLRGGAMTAVTKGGTVTDNTGAKVDMDLGGVFVGLMFRFYIPPLH
jgi:hypothetical protein